MTDFYLKKKLVIWIFILIASIFICIKMWFQKDIHKLQKKKYIPLKIIISRFLPILFFLSVLFFAIKPVLDLIDPNKYDYSVVDTLNAVSSNNSRKTSWVGEYTIKIGETTYRIPNSLIAFNKLKIGDIYEIKYFNNSKLIYSIEPIE